MMDYDKREFIDENIQKKRGKKRSVKDFLDGSVLIRDMVLKQLPFIIFLAVLSIMYIANRYHAERLYRETAVLKKQVKEVRSSAISTAAELMHISKQSEVSKMIKEKGLELKESREPPIVIKVEKEDL
jgi:methylthioribose-1-phosphate isomerase